MKKELIELIIKEYVNGKSMNKIAQENNINISSVRYYLMKNNIKIRGISESVNKTLSHKDKIQLSDTNRQIIIGNLLGDGSIRKQAKRAHYNHVDKHIEYLKWLKQQLEVDGITFTNIYPTANKCFALQSHTYSVFNQFYDMFYIDNNRIVPDNIELTPIILRQWYISDGSIATHGGIYIAKATDVKVLLSKLRETLNIDVTYHYDKKRNYGKFYISKNDSVKFLNYIGNCPVKCYEYKWDI